MESTLQQPNDHGTKDPGKIAGLSFQSTQSLIILDPVSTTRLDTGGSYLLGCQCDVSLKGP